MPPTKAKWGAFLPDMKPYKYCPYCTSELVPQKRGGRIRQHCSKCDLTFYRNPTVGVAVVLLDEQKRILLGKRSSGKWCIPCGHVEWDEAVETAAKREILEETGLSIHITGVFAVKSNFHDPEHHTVGIWYLGQVISGTMQPGGDLFALEYYNLSAIPELEFPTDREVINELRHTLI